MNFSITSHTIVKNEECFIKYALLSIEPFVERMLIWDTGSTDKTVKIIKSLKSPKIELRQFDNIDRTGLVKLRNEQIKISKTPWFLLLDGDEIWPEKNLKKLINSMKTSKDTTIALVNKTRNCVADIYHYQPDSKGKYKIGNWSGHLNIRAIRNNKSLKVVGQYPQEAYTINSIPIQKQINELEFVDTWYLHTTHLKRTSWNNSFKVIDRLKKYKFWGKKLKINPADLPEVFFSKPRNKLF